MSTCRMGSVSPSSTLALNDEVSKLKASGVDVISFTLGEPDFDTPPQIVEDAVNAMNAGFTHYTPSPGIPDLRKAVADIYSSRNGIPCEPGNVIVSPAKTAIFNCLLALIDSGEEVLIPDPGWVSYDPMTVLVGGEPVPYPLDEGFHIDIEALKEAVSPRTRIMILNTPSNPCGTLEGIDTLKAISDLAVDNDIIVISDEVYERIIFEGKHISLASLPGMFERTVTIFSTSKAWAMSGWRAGWCIAPDHIYKDLIKVQQNVVTCATSFVQVGALSALTETDEDVEKMVETYRKRRDFIVDGLNSAPGIECNSPEGTFYAFPKFEADMDSFEFARHLLRSANVAVTPGEAFGCRGAGCFRLSFASSMEDLQKGADRIRTAMEGL